MVLIPSEKQHVNVIIQVVFISLPVILIQPKSTVCYAYSSSHNHTEKVTQKLLHGKKTITYSYLNQYLRDMVDKT